MLHHGTGYSRKDLIDTLNRQNEKISTAAIRNEKIQRTTAEAEIVRRDMGPGRYSTDNLYCIAQAKNGKFDRSVRFNRHGLKQPEREERPHLGPGCYDFERAFPDYYTEGFCKYIFDNPFLYKTSRMVKDLKLKTPLGTKMNPIYHLTKSKHITPKSWVPKDPRFRPSPQKNSEPVGPGRYELAGDDISNKMWKEEYLRLKRHETRRRGHSARPDDRLKKFAGVGVQGIGYIPLGQEEEEEESYRKEL